MIALFVKETLTAAVSEIVTFYNNTVFGAIGTVQWCVGHEETEPGSLPVGNLYADGDSF